MASIEVQEYSIRIVAVHAHRRSVRIAHGNDAEETARRFCQENAIPNWRTVKSAKALDLSRIAEG